MPTVEFLPNHYLCNQKIMKHRLGIYVFLVVFTLPLPSPVLAVSIEELSQAIAMAPAERLHSYYVYRSRAYLALGDEENGLADLQASLQVKPSAEAYLFRGEYFQKTNRLDDAISDYSAALAINKDCVKAYRLRSAAYYDKKEYAQAIIDASFVKLYNEEDPFALNMIEKCYVQSSPKERIVLRSNVASVMRSRKARQSGGAGSQRYRPAPAKHGNKVAAVKTKRKTKKCGPRRRS